MDDIIKPTGQGGTENTRKLVSGWKDIMAGKTMSRQERIIKEQQEKAQKIKSGVPLTEDTNYKPGQDDAPSEPMSLREMRKTINKMNEQKRVQKTFKGSAEQCIIKICSLLGTTTPDEPGRKFERGKILTVEEAGFGQYKVTYLPE